MIIANTHYVLSSTGTGPAEKQRPRPAPQRPPLTIVSIAPPISAGRRAEIARVVERQTVLIENESLPVSLRLAAARTASGRLSRLEEGDVLRTRVASAIRRTLFQNPDPAVRRQAVDAYAGAAAYSNSEIQEGNAALQGLFRDPDLDVRLSALSAAYGRFGNLGNYGFNPTALREGLREAYIVDAGRMRPEDYGRVFDMYRATAISYHPATQTRNWIPEERARLQSRIAELSRPGGDAAALGRARWLDRSLP